MNDDLKAAFEAYLAGVVPGTGVTAEAMRYALSGGGKRLRPLLLFGVAAACGKDPVPLFPAAAAVEAIHQYSLIHDDLPAMDDDDRRRGRPTVHRAFDEATAILAGDGLQALAFALLSAPELVRATGEGAALSAVGILSRAAGITGMVGGQDLDISGASQPRVDVNRLKTGALFAAAAAMGAVFGGRPDWEGTLERFGEALGLAYQDIDDLFDLARDERSHRLDETTLREEARRHTNAAHAALEPLGESAKQVREFAEALLARQV